MIDEAIEDPDQKARRALLEALSTAFRDNPMNIEIHGPRPGRRVRANRAGLRSLVLDSVGRTVMRAIRDRGEVVGGFVLGRPGVFPISSPSLGRQVSCLLVQGRQQMARWSDVSSHLMQFRPNEDHWYLSVLGVVPQAQGRGFGRRLLDELMRVVRTDPHPVYLESDREASVRFYLANGFEILAESTHRGVRCWCVGKGFAGENANLCDSVREFEAISANPPT